MSLNSVFQFFVPKDKKFFPLFEKASKQLTIMASTLHDAVNAPKGEREELFKKVEELEAEIEEKVYHLFCDQDSPVEHVKAALLHMIGYCDQIIEAAKAAAPVVEEVVSDVEKVAEVVVPLVEEVAPLL